MFAAVCPERLDLLDGRLDAGVCAGYDRETDVPFSATIDEPVSATSRISADLDPAGDHRHVIAHLVTGCDPRGQLCDRVIQHGEVIGHGVRPRVAWPEEDSEGVAGRVGEAEERMEPVMPTSA